MAFPHGGKSKNSEKQLSLTGEIGKPRKLDKTFGVMFILTLHCSLFCKKQSRFMGFIQRPCDRQYYLPVSVQASFRNR